MHTRITVTLVVLFSFAFGAQQQPQPTFKSTVQVVEVDVRVFDKDGRFVRDLKAEDFELIEDDAPQKIEAVFLVEPAATSDAPSTVSSREPVAAASDPAPAPVAPQTWIFFFDLAHLTPGGGFDRARKAVEDFVRDRFKQGDIAGILAGDKMINNRLTSVREELLGAVKEVKPRNDSRTRFIELTREWPRFMNEEEAIRIARNEREWIARAVQRACSDDPGQCQMAETAVMQKGSRFRTEIHQSSMVTMSALNGLASGLARIPGPKTVVFLSYGFVIQDVATTLRSVVGQITRAGARVYAIDVRGLDRAGQRNIIDQGLVDDPAGPFLRTDTVADGPNSVAVDTGGLMIRNENNIGRALDRVAEDAGRYYVLAYQPANPNFDGKYRPIQVRVKRDGLRVRARRGYLALPPARMTVPKPLPPSAPKKDEEVRTATESEPAATAPPPEAPIPPVETLPATGTVVGEPADAGTSAGVRLRPDIEGRVRALSDREGGARDDLEKRGWDAYERGDIETAAELLSKAAAEPRAELWVHYALGMAQAGLGRPDDAIRSWEVVRKGAPDFEPVYMDLADTYAAKSDLSAALAIVRDAQKRWPESAEVHSAIGVIHVRRGALDEGIESLEKVTALTPDDPLAHLNLARAYALRFHRGRRYVTSQRRWIAPEGDRQKALAAFSRCVDLGGPYAQQAKNELALLEWVK
ncbi:MAG TPA: VWA domain-containing protein [Vicinamibacterales bacterium]